MEEFKVAGSRTGEIVTSSEDPEVTALLRKIEREVEEANRWEANCPKLGTFATENSLRQEKETTNEPTGIHEVVLSDEPNAYNWRDYSLCRNLDVGMFFPDIEQDVEPAKAVCNSCPAKTHCLEFALQTGQDDGIWGGATEAERRRLKRRRRQASLSA